MRYLLDTNICIYIIKQSPSSVYDRFRKLRVGDIGISAITCYELQFGVAKSQRPEENQLVLTEFLAPLEVLDLPAAAAPKFGELRAHLEKKGTPVGNYDLMIATHAIFLDTILVTNNTREFKRIPGLKIENWV